MGRDCGRCLGGGDGNVLGKEKGAKGRMYSPSPNLRMVRLWVHMMMQVFVDYLAACDRKYDHRDAHLKINNPCT